MTTVNLEEDALKEIADIVYQTSGIVFKDSNLSVLISRVSSKLKEKQMESGAYLSLLKRDKNR